MTGRERAALGTGEALQPVKAWRHIVQDYEVLTKKHASLRAIVGRFLSDAGFRAVCLYRFGRALYTRGARVRPKLIQMWMLRSCQCTISVAAEIGSGFCIRHVGGIVIGGRSVAGKNFEIRQGVTLGGNVGKVLNGRSQPTIGDNVRVGAGAAILGPVEVGSGVVIGANAVVVDDVPDDAVAVGVPARVVRVKGRRVELEERRDSLATVLNELNQQIAELQRRMAFYESTNRKD